MPEMPSFNSAQSVLAHLAQQGLLERPDLFLNLQEGDQVPRLCRNNRNAMHNFLESQGKAPHLFDDDAEMSQ
jgi:hypothetical protein